MTIKKAPVKKKTPKKADVKKSTYKTELVDGKIKAIFSNGEVKSFGL